jgi:hypothetical protein
MQIQTRWVRPPLYLEMASAASRDQQAFHACTETPYHPLKSEHLFLFQDGQSLKLFASLEVALRRRVAKRLVAWPSGRFAPDSFTHLGSVFSTELHVRRSRPRSLVALLLDGRGTAGLVYETVSWILLSLPLIFDASQWQAPNAPMADPIGSFCLCLVLCALSLLLAGLPA